MIMFVIRDFCSGLLRVVVSLFFFFKQKTAYEMRISDWSSDVCSSDLIGTDRRRAFLGDAPRAMRPGDDVARLCRHRLARRDDHPRHLLPLAVLTAGPVTHAPSMHAGRRLGKGIGGHRRSYLLPGRRDRRKGEKQGKPMAHRNTAPSVRDRKRGGRGKRG